LSSEDVQALNPYKLRRGLTSIVAVIVPRPALTIPLPAAIPPMIVAHVPVIAFPVPFEIATALVIRGDPVGTCIRRPRPVSVVPEVPAVRRIPVAFDPVVAGPRFRRYAVGAWRRRLFANRHAE